MSKKNQTTSSDKEDLIKLIEDRKKEINLLKKLMQKLASSSTNSITKTHSK